MAAISARRSSAAERHEERVGSGRVPEAERCLHGVTLAHGQPVELSERRPQQLVEPRESKVRFRLHTARLEHGEAVSHGARAGDAEKRGLADAGLADDHECAAVLGQRPDELLDDLDLGVASEHVLLSKRHGHPLR